MRQGVNASFAKNNSRTAKSAGTGRSDKYDRFLAQGKLMSMVRVSVKAEPDHHCQKTEMVENIKAMPRWTAQDPKKLRKQLADLDKQIVGLYAHEA